MMLLFLQLMLLFIASPLQVVTAEEQPHIVIIMADDMGFNDVSYRGSNQFLTPNIDALAYSGVILDNLYTPPMCTPSRAALLTGRYPINTGMQHFVIVNDQPWGLPLSEALMPKVFQENGYYTALIGKWHLGMSRQKYTPTRRGFNYHYGYLGAFIDYYNHTLYMEHDKYERGHDLRENLTVQYENGNYATDLFTDAALKVIATHDASKKPLFLLLSHLAPHAGNEDDPLQVPADEIKKFSYIKSHDRRIYAGMMSKLDESVGRVIDGLTKKGILNNTIILFYSDNGGPTLGLHATTASNYPLRGQKNSPWEGGLRSSASIWSSKLNKLGTVWRQKLYVADIFPTLAIAAGIKLKLPRSLDGLNFWQRLRDGSEPIPREIVHNIDDIFNYYAYLSGKWKLIRGTTVNGTYDGWLGTTGNANEVDPRSSRYAHTIRKSSVWQQLSVLNANAKNIDFESMRRNIRIKCGSAQSTCEPLHEYCLFDIDVDPCEQNNLFEQYKDLELVHKLISRVKYFRARARRPENKPSDPQADPRYYNGEWTWWQDKSSNIVALLWKHWSQLFAVIAITIIIVILFNLF